MNLYSKIPEARATQKQTDRRMLRAVGLTEHVVIGASAAVVLTVNRLAVASRDCVCGVSRRRVEPCPCVCVID